MRTFQAYGIREERISLFLAKFIVKNSSFINMDDVDEKAVYEVSKIICERNKSTEALLREKRAAIEKLTEREIKLLDIKI
jgi:hypothetical protein